MRRRRNAPAAPVTTVSAEDHPTSNPRWRSALAWILLPGLSLVPLFISLGGDDHFRLPKELLLYAVAVLAAATALAGLLTGGIRINDVERSRLRPFVLLATGGMLWAVVSTIFATNRALAIEALIWAAALTSLFLTSILAMPVVSPKALALAVFPPAIANTIVIMLQASRVWNPWVFPTGTPFRMTKNALLGNPDDVGVYLALPLLFAVTLALHAKRRRIVYAALAIALANGLLLSMTITAIGAFGVALLFVLVTWDRRRGLAIVIVAAIALLSAVLLYGPLEQRTRFLLRSVAEGHWGRVVSGRLLPFATTADIFLHHPVTGVGPGCFKFEYMPARVALEDRWPRLAQLSETHDVNFAEAHNDHLQLLAEVGVPGYLAVLAGIILVAWPMRRRRVAAGDERADIARALAVPLVLMTLVTMMAQFALQLAAPMSAAVLIAAACVAWRERDAA